jgi:hypothetical protein
MPDLIFGFSANNDAVSTDQNTSVTFDPTSNDNLPDGFDTFTIISGPDEGSIDVMGSSITYIPNMDYCGNDEIVYEICKNMDCDQGTIAISVVCDSGYPLYDIATITTVNADGLPDSLGVSCQLQGIVYGVDLQGANDNIQFYFIDGTGGTSLFANTDFGYTVQEGDEIIVQGTITQFNCLAQITPDTLWLISTGNDLVAPTVVTTLDESTEGELIMIENLTLVDPGQWNPGGSGFNVDVTNGNDTYQMRIDNDVNLFGASAPSTPFNAIGLGGQFDNSAPCDDGYQFLPRYEEDIIFLDATIDKSLSQKIQFFPNPTDGMLNIRSDIQLDRVIIFNLLGQKMLESQNLDNQIEVYNFPAGIYTITFVSGDSFWVTEFVKR